MASIITADTGAVSGSAGLKSSADSSGVLALATGTGTTAVTIDASQNVGVGTTSPNNKLHVVGTEYATVVESASSTTGDAIRMAVKSAATEGQVEIDWFNDSARTGGGYGMLQVGKSSNSPDLAIMAGRVGIGTSAPLGKLDIILSGASRRLIATYDDSLVTLKSANNSSNPEVLQIVADRIQFNTGTSGSGTERMRIDSSGNVGIGTSSPLDKLDVVSASGAYRNRIRNSGANESVLLFQNSNTGTATNDGLFLGITGSMDAFLWNYENNPLVFGTNNTERARIDSSGNLLVGTTSGSTPNPGLVLNPGTNSAIQIGHGSGAVSGSSFAVFRYNGTAIGYIDQNGTTGVTFATSSDYRLKNITGPITTSGSYIDSLNPVEGTWKADGSTFVGLIAHETQEASRTTVATGVKDGVEMQGMDYSSAEIIANLIAEIQSLRKRLAAAGI
jgi:hypothetical protein